MNILVTGGAGFIGSNFVRYALEASEQATVYNLDSLTYASSLASLPKHDRHVFLRGDILNVTLLEYIFKELNIDWVVHFAAETHVDRSIVSPDAFVKTNVEGTFRVLEAVRKHSPGTRFHHISTDEVYGSLDRNGDDSFSEESPYSPNSPYAASKAASDHLVQAYGHTYGLDFTISNCSNNYGPYQFPEKLIPRMILSAVTHEPLPVHGDGTNVRDWLHVYDHCDAVWCILNSGSLGETYNIGGNHELANIEVVNMIASQLKDYRPEIAFVPDRLGNDKRYSVDTSKIERELGWKSKRHFALGLVQTVNWYLENLAWLMSARDQLDYTHFDLYYKERKT